MTVVLNVFFINEANFCVGVRPVRWKLQSEQLSLFPHSTVGWKTQVFKDALPTGSESLWLQTPETKLNLELTLHIFMLPPVLTFIQIHMQEKNLLCIKGFLRNALWWMEIKERGVGLMLTYMHSHSHSLKSDGSTLDCLPWYYTCHSNTLQKKNQIISRACRAQQWE